MKIGTLADWFGVGLIEGIRESERCGAQGVQVYAAGELHPKDLTREKLELVKRTARDCRQRSPALCGELGDLDLKRREDNPEKIDYLKRRDRSGSGSWTAGLSPPTSAWCRPTHDHPHTRSCWTPAGKRPDTPRAVHIIAVETGPEPLKTLGGPLCGRLRKGRGDQFRPGEHRHGRRTDDPVPAVVDAESAIVHTHAKDGRSLSPSFRRCSITDLPKTAWKGCAPRPLHGRPLWVRKRAVDRRPTSAPSIRLGYNGFLTIEREAKNGAEDIRMAVRFLRETIAAL